VKDNAAKIKALIDMAHFHFERKEPFLVFVEDLKAEQFVDELFWKSPPHSFLPHSIAQEETTDWVVITRAKKNITQARVAFNLCSTPLLIDGFRIIYEFEDLSSPGKKHLSSIRLDAYQQAGITIEAR
jgi:DNA polymerase IIIc chi subunit